MIHTDKGDITIKGTAQDIFADFGVILYELLKQELITPESIVLLLAYTQKRVEKYKEMENANSKD